VIKNWKLLRKIIHQVKVRRIKRINGNSIGIFQSMNHRRKVLNLTVRTKRSISLKKLRASFDRSNLSTVVCSEGSQQHEQPLQCSEIMKIRGESSRGACKNRTKREKFRIFVLTCSIINNFALLSFQERFALIENATYRIRW
jgi:hypothetical protein